MASLMLRTCSKIGINPSPVILNRISRYATDIDKALTVNEAPQICTKELVKMKEESRTIEVPAENVSVVTGIPEEHIKTRTARIFKPPKNAMQGGDQIHYWHVDFDQRERWENPLMGWVSTGDPHSNLQVEFSTKEDAIAYCEKNGWKYFVQEPNKMVSPPRNYSTNFSWNSRTRVSTK